MENNSLVDVLLLTPEISIKIDQSILNRLIESTRYELR
jgi:hypothetical protein